VAPRVARARLSSALAERPPRLDRALLAIATLDDPELVEEPVLERLDALADRVRKLLPQGTQAPMCDQLSALRQVLSGEENFCGERQRYFCPDNSFLPRVLERKKGLPITLCALWVEVARRAGIPLYGISFPGHFLAGATWKDELFVLDPFHGGRSLDTEALEALLQKMAPELPLTDALLAPAGVEQIVWRMLSNLRRVYLGNQDATHALGVVDLMLLLAPDHPGELRTRAALLASIGAFKSALADVERCLELTPDAPDSPGLARVREELVHKISMVN
jgi:regulator of sirC expression with transglutaminase-like and TPR domain